MNVPAKIQMLILETLTNYWVNSNLQLWSITNEISLPAPFKDNLQPSSSVSIVSGNSVQILSSIQPFLPWLPRYSQGW